MGEAEDRHRENIDALEALASGDRAPLVDPPAKLTNDNPLRNV